jgi:riboflavin synthase
MFTGIIESLGELAEVKTMASGYRLRVETPLANELRSGDSLAVNGVCLTVTLANMGSVHADIGPGTAKVTTFGLLQRDHLVNLERPLRFDTRVGGHFVQGHVDGIGTVQGVQADGDSHWITVGFPPTLAPYFIRKGSVAVDGVSLTIAGLGERQFDLQIIPFTWEHTALHTARPGDKVNLECDMIGKYVVRAMELSGNGKARKGPSPDRTLE